MESYHQQSQRFIKNSRKRGMDVKVQDGQLRAFPKKKLLPRLAPKKKQISQRDSYGAAMMRAQRKGGSNGIGVGK